MICSLSLCYFLSVPRLKASLLFPFQSFDSEPYPWQRVPKSHITLHITSHVLPLHCVKENKGSQAQRQTKKGTKEGEVGERRKERTERKR